MKTTPATTSRVLMRAAKLVRTLFATAVVGILAAPTPSLGGTAVAPPVNWSTYGFDLARTGYNPAESTIGPANAAGLHELWSLPLGGAAVTQAVYALGVPVHGHRRNVVYVGATDGVVYAVDADAGRPIWKRSLGRIPAFQCGIYGIGGGSAIDRPNNAIFVPGARGKIYALDLSTGATRPGWPVTITTHPRYEYVWDALTLSDGELYAGIASYCDQEPYDGRLVKVAVSSATVTGVFYVTGDPSVSGGGIWGWGGTSVDPAGNLYIATGNALNENEAYGYSEQVVKLSPDLDVIASNYPGVTGFDVDFGSTPVLYQPAGCPPQLAVENKDGHLFIYKANDIGAGPVQALHTANYEVSGLIGLPAYSPVDRMLFMANPSDSPDGQYKAGILAFDIQPDCTLSLAWQQTYGQGVTFNVPPTPTVANGVVYAADGGSIDPSTLRAFDAKTGQILWSRRFDGGDWSSPIVVNGKLFTVPGDHVLHAFGV